jgi:hypothetical protein
VKVVKVDHQVNLVVMVMTRVVLVVVVAPLVVEEMDHQYLDLTHPTSLVDALVIKESL